MELDDLKVAWSQLGRGRETLPMGIVSTLRDGKLDQTRSALGRVAWVLRYELAAGVVATLLLGSFLADHWRTARFLLSALVLHEYAVITILIAARQMVLLSRVDFSVPVLTVQRELTRLRTFRIWSTLGLMIVAPLLWAPLAIVGAKGLFDLDVYRAFGAAWVWGNLAIGLAVIPLGLWLARRLAARNTRSPRVAAFMEMLSGRSLADAKRYADELARFATES
jgi:hypothetical protein